MGGGEREGMGKFGSDVRMTYCFAGIRTWGCDRSIQPDEACPQKGEGERGVGRVAEMVPTGWGMLKVAGEWVLDQPKLFCTGDNLSITKCICHWSVVWKGIFFEATCGMDES